MSNKHWIKRAKRIAAASNYIPPFVKVALQLELHIEKPSIALPAPQVGDPGMVRIRQQARAYRRGDLPAPSRSLPAGSAVALKLEIDEREVKAEILAAIAAGRSTVTVAEMERLLALPYRRAA